MPKGVYPRTASQIATLNEGRKKAHSLPRSAKQLEVLQVGREARNNRKKRGHNSVGRM